MENTIQSIETYLKDRSLSSDFLQPGLYDELCRLTKCIIEDIRRMIEDKEVNDMTKEITDCLNRLLAVVITTPISERNGTFLKDFCSLTFNLNNNLKKDETINTLSISIIRFVDNHFTIVESIEVLKALTKTFKDLKSWLPPSFEISKHFSTIMMK